MAIETNIIIELGRWGVRIPEIVHVRKGTLVRFLLRSHNPFSSPQLFPPLGRIELYFENGTPKGLESRYSKRIEAQRSDENHNTSPYEVLVAEGIVESTGDYKYGVKASSTLDEEIFDEDPYLIIHW